MRAKHNDYFCKHIYFIVKRVLKCSDEICDKKRFQKKHLTELFSQIETIPQNVIYNADPMMIDSNVTAATGRKPISEEDSCPICLEDLLNGNDLIYCMLSCGNSIHKTCFDMWSLKKPEQQCVYCRGAWKKQIAMTKEKVLEQLSSIQNQGGKDKNENPNESEAKNEKIKEDEPVIITLNMSRPKDKKDKHVLKNNQVQPAKPKKALEFFADEITQKIHSQGLDWLIGKALNKEISNKWKLLSNEEKEKYFQLSDKDSERFNKQEKYYTEKGFYTNGNDQEKLTTKLNYDADDREENATTVFKVKKKNGKAK